MTMIEMTSLRQVVDADHRQRMVANLLGATFVMALMISGYWIVMTLRAAARHAPPGKTGLAPHAPASFLLAVPPPRLVIFVVPPRLVVIFVVFCYRSPAPSWWRHRPPPRPSTLHRSNSAYFLGLSQSLCAYASLPTAPEDLRRRDFTIRQDPPQETLCGPSLAPVRTGLEDNLLQFHRPLKAFDGVDGRSIRRRQIRGVSQPFFRGLRLTRCLRRPGWHRWRERLCWR
jgi:hypothetical protein